MNKLLRVASLLASLYALGAAPAFGQPTEITIAAWNVEGVKFDDNGNPHPIFKAARLAEAILLINPDVIALVEVFSRTEVAEIVDILESETGRNYRYTMPNQTVPQKLAIIFRDDNVRLDSRQLLPGTDAGQPDRLRKALAARMRAGNFDFEVIAVHLKSERTDEARETRNTQVRAINDYIVRRRTQSAERDFLVVGDYNMIPGQDSVNFTNMSPDSFLRFVSSETLSPPSHVRSCSNNAPRGNLLDGYAVSRNHTTEFVAGSLSILQMHTLLGVTCNTYKAEYADHLPLVARFRTNQNGTDDDQ
ncbi:MAG TPA: endonuclease/exonuclease/phosphatase family protein [Pyrinomonadaceae bacterium]|nr:endonuclease/exonuclease/phosphatase family protein [Pyrinomonadaceae bacterium]